MGKIEELYNEIAALHVRSDLFDVDLKPLATSGTVERLKRTMDWLVITEDESGESRYPCYYADSALTIYNEYEPERIYQRTGKRAFARLEHKGVTIAIKYANDIGYISRIMREGYGLKY